jgi:hypothetical protein
MSRKKEVKGYGKSVDPVKEHLHLTDELASGGWARGVVPRQEGYVVQRSNGSGSLEFKE